MRAVWRLLQRVMGAQIVLTPVRGISTLQQFVRPHHTIKHGFVFKAPPHIKDKTARMFSARDSIIKFVECNELHGKWGRTLKVLQQCGVEIVFF